MDLFLSRRALLRTAFFATAAALARYCIAADHPSVDNFESGDLLWPKQKGAYVPFRAASYDLAEERRVWEEERKNFLVRIRAEPRYFSQSDINKLETIDFATFHARYTEDVEPGEARPFSSGAGRITVGHVGIVLIENGLPYVIEAVPAAGVRKITYTDWIKERPEQLVWQGRLRDLEAAERAKLAMEARKYIGRPYDFWNFDLNDDRGFYCSKLVWLSAYRALGYAVDGQANPQRTFWFSPKQLLNAQKIKRLFEPGD